MSGALPELEKKFTVSVFRSEDDIVFRLVPISSIAGRYLAAVVIHYDKSSGIPKGIEMTTPRGDKTITRLSEVKTNPGLDAETFKIKLPSDVRITNLEK
jgi:outer membrane lipoprotein-sorting protein